jgi:hypothetical protein
VGQLGAGAADGAVSPGARPRADGLAGALASAAGVAALADAVEDARREEGWRVTAWPPARVLAARRRAAAEPQGAGEGEGPRSRPARGGAARGGAPAVTAGPPPPASRPAVADAVRAVVEEAGAALPSGWAEAAGARVTPSDEVAAALDAAVSEVDLAPGPRPPAWRSRRLGQVGCAVLAVLGLVGLLAGGVILLAGAAPAGLPGGPLLVPLLLTVLGVAGGPALAATSPGAVDAESARRRDAAEEALRAAVRDVAQRHVLEPLDEEWSRLARFREACAAARGT